MTGLLGNIGAALGGLLGSPRAKDALLLSIASGGDPRFAAGLMGQRNEMQRANKQDELYQLKMEEARRKADEARLAQQRQQQSQSALASLSLLSPEYQAMYRNDPAFQQAFRANQVAYGDPAAAEQSGLLAPLPTPAKMPTSYLEYQLAKDNPGYAASLSAKNEAQRQDPTLFAPQFFEQDGKWFAVQFDNRTGQQVQTQMPEGWRPQSQTTTPGGVNKIIESQLNAAQQAQQFSSKVDQALAAFNSIPDEEWNAGFKGTAAEAFKSTFGYQDAQSYAKALYTDVRNSGILNSLPPGVASDRDVALVLEGTLPANAPKPLIMQYMRGVQKLAMLRAEYGNFAAEYVSTNPMRGMAGLPQAWNSYLADTGRTAPGSAIVPDSPPSQTRKKYNPATGTFE